MIVTILLIVFVFSAWGLIQYQQWKFKDVFFDYNGFEIRQVEHGYRIKLVINDQQDNPIYIRLRNKPQDLEAIPIEGMDIEADVRQKESFFLTIDPQQNLTGRTTVAALEIDSVLDNAALYSIHVNSAVTASADQTKTVKTCKDVNATTGIIWLRLADQEAIRGQDGCIMLQAPNEDGIIRAADAFLYRVLGIIPSTGQQKV